MAAAKRTVGKGKQSRKQLAGKDKAPAKRNEFTGIAQQVVDAHEAAEKGTASQLSLILKAADLTHNTEAGRDKFRDALNAAYLAKKCAVKTARVYVSEAIRVCKAYFVTMPVQMDGEEQAVKKSGKELFEGRGYGFAKKLASQILAANGTKDTRGKKTGKKPAKALNKGQIIDQLDKVIAAVRTSAVFPKAVLAILLDAKAHAIGDGSDKAALGMSRGQKAAATRRANAKGNRVITVPAGATIQ